MRIFALPAISMLVVFLIPQLAFAQLNREEPDALQNLDVEEHLGEYVPLDALFANEKGDSVTIGDLLVDDKPVILNPVYYECPMLCGLVLDGVEKVVHELEWKPGKDFNIITFSIDPEENHQIAASNKAHIMSAMRDESIGDGWHFLTGNKTQIDRVVDAIGFKYKKIAHTEEYAHSAVIMFISPEGKITRYLYGISYDEFNVRNALYEAADGKIGNTITKVLMYCYQYDPDSDSYVPIAFNIMKLGGLATLIFLGIFLGPLWLRGRLKKSTSKS